MKRRTAIILVSLFALMAVTGCGETINGISKDVQRVTKGVQTIFFRDNAR